MLNNLRGVYMKRASLTRSAYDGKTKPAITMKKFKIYLLRTLSAALAAFAISVFFTPNKIVNGGVSGVATILYHTLGISTGLSFAVINFTLLLLGFKILGKEFVGRTVYVSGILSVFVELFSRYIPQVEIDLFLAALFGAIIYGIGLGIAFATGASSGGTDILGRIFQWKFPNMPIGKVLLIVDGIIITASLIIFGEINLTCYGIIALSVSTTAIDWLIAKLNFSRIAFIITDKGEEISDKLGSTSPRGVTLIDVKGAYTKESKKMLFCALKDSEVEGFQRKILEIDENAFVVFSESQKIVGNGFYLYR